MTASDERFLVEAAQRGDVDAFGDLVRRHELQVYRVALRMLGSQADAEDAAQEAWIRAWRSIRRFRRGSSFATWVYRIVTNHCLNVISRRRPTVELEDRHAGDRRHEPQAAAERRAELSAVTAAIAGLPAEQRAALVLREFEGLSYDEVAEVLETSVSAVKGRVHRGRLAVARQMEGWR